MAQPRSPGGACGRICGIRYRGCQSEESFHADGCGGILASFQSSQHGEHEAGEHEAASDESVPGDDRIEPFFGPRSGSQFVGGSESETGPGGQSTGSPFSRLTAKAAQAASTGAERFFGSGAKAIRVKEKSAVIAAAQEDAGDLFGVGALLPPLGLLAPPPAVPHRRDAADPQLMERAAALMSVLSDFGVKGRITGIYPGPVITLFELEPVRGTKSSRVVSLADDIARSMSAVSARIAVVPGRDAIGIELPNPKREMVSLREILEFARVSKLASRTAAGARKIHRRRTDSG